MKSNLSSTLAAGTAVALASTCLVLAFGSSVATADGAYLDRQVDRDPRTGKEKGGAP